jgi:hypothetical protein
VDCYTFLWLQFISLDVRKVKSHVDQPSPKPLEQLELFQKRILKQILS